MNSRQRKNKQLREYRAEVTAVTANPDVPTRPLKGFEEFYAITINGDLWSQRLKRFIKPTLGMDGLSLYLKFSIQGTEHRLPVWQSVADAWLDDVARGRVIDRIPEVAVVGDRIKWELAAIPEIAKEFDLPHGLIRSFVAVKHKKKMELKTKTRFVFIEDDREFLLNIESQVGFLDVLEDQKDLEFSVLCGHPDPASVVARPLAKVVCNDPCWSIDILEQYFSDRSKEAGNEIFPPHVTRENKSLGLTFDSDEFEGLYTFVLFAAEGGPNPIGYSVGLISASVWDNGEIHLAFSLESIFIAPQFTGRAYGASLAVYTGELLGDVYRYFGLRATAGGHRVCITLYSDFLSPGGERCTNIVADELIVARDMLIDKNGVSPDMLEELVDETGF